VAVELGCWRRPEELAESAGPGGLSPSSGCDFIMSPSAFPSIRIAHNPATFSGDADIWNIMSDEPEQPQGKAESTSRTISAVALLAAVLTAVLTGAVSYGYGVVSDIRKTKIEFVDEQPEVVWPAIC
jgi:hypothetical protein